MDTSDLLTIAGMLVGQLVLLGTLMLGVGKWLFNRIDSVKTDLTSTEVRLRAEVASLSKDLRTDLAGTTKDLRMEIDNLGKEVQKGHLEIVANLSHLTGRIDQFLGHPPQQSATG